MKPIPLSYLVAASHFASCDETREVLYSVAITDGHVVATDGQAMAIIKLDPLFEAPSDGKQFVLSLKDLKLLTTVKKQRKIELDVTVQFNDDLTWACSGLDLSGKLVDIRYPNWKQVWPTKVPDTKVPFVSLDPDYLIAAHKAFKSLSGKAKVVGLKITPTGDERSPYLVAPSCVKSELKVIVMSVQVA